MLIFNGLRQDNLRLLVFSGRDRRTVVEPMDVEMGLHQKRRGGAALHIGF